jgi:hypothetical protein
MLIAKLCAAALLSTIPFLGACSNTAAKTDCPPSNGVDSKCTNATGVGASSAPVPVTPH